MQMNHILQEPFIDTIFTLSNRRSHSYLSQRGVQFRWAWSHWGVQTSRSTGVTRNTGKQYSALINGLSLMATACMKIFCNWRQKRKLKFGSEFKEWSILLSFSHPSVKSGFLNTDTLWAVDILIRRWRSCPILPYCTQLYLRITSTSRQNL